MVNKEEDIKSDESMDVCIYRQSLQATNSFNNVYTKSANIEGTLSSSEMQAAASN